MQWKKVNNMGTRSRTIIMDDGKVVASMYRQYDGYLSGHGLDLKQAFGKMKVVDGYSPEDKTSIANGLDCLAAQIVAHFKKGVGGVYLDSSDYMLQEYTYILYVKSGNRPRKPIHVRVLSSGSEIYDGLLSKMPTNDNYDNQEN